jgi:organic hydroperoxide reductase OsmC/OhrA
MVLSPSTGLDAERRGTLGFGRLHELRRAWPSDGGVNRMKSHHYRAGLRWTGNRGGGTEEYRAYGRDHVVTFPGKAPLPGSSDPEFRGDPTRYNPEELLVGSLSACHMLWYLHLCAADGIVVEEYSDDAEGVMETGPDGSGRFTLVTLHPHVTISRGSEAKAAELHDVAQKRCFIANSVNFPVRHAVTTSWVAAARPASTPPNE